MRNNLFYIFFVLFIPTIAYSQNVGIGTDKPVKSALLDLSSTDKGFLLPRLTEKQKALIKSPAEGLMIYQYDNNQGVYIFQNKSWISLGVSKALKSNSANITLALTPNYLLKADSDGNAVSSGIYVDPLYGNIGVGVSNPTIVSGYTTTHIQGSGGGILRLTDQTGRGGLVAGNAAGFIFDSGDLSTNFVMRGQTKVLFKSDGNVGIGTTNPTIVSGYTNTHIQGSGGGILRLTDGTGKGGLVAGNAAGFIFDSGDLSTNFVMGGKTNVIFRSDGNVGIGTSNPTIVSGYLTQHNQGEGGSILRLTDKTGKGGLVAGNAAGFIFDSGDLSTNFVMGGQTKVLFKSDGKVGIGKTNPSTLLDVNGDASFKNILTLNTQTGYLAIGNFDAANPMPIPNGYRLVVEDGIITEKIKVALKSSTDWADYVFDKNYKLNDLKFVENYIKEHKHLPNVPSAVELYNNGIDLAETSKMFMEKIEELTLYIIQLKKEIEDLKK